ncbi:hypothetical protein ACHAWO_010019 [Cyclotella atomus]|uniref:Mitochondrial import inner membrane translocase subunit n=1 Tax=Cyclotella atomus TaxID=382360 RepID=A0ABD3MXY3_9STRA
MEGVPNLPPHLQGEFMKQMENMQMKDSLRSVWLLIPVTCCDWISDVLIFSTLSVLYNNLVSKCFTNCVTSFRSKSLDKYETSCVENCAERYIKMTQRVGLRFAESQALQQKRAAEMMGK